MFFTLQLLWILFLENQVMEAIADLDSFDRLDLSENRLALSIVKNPLSLDFLISYFWREKTLNTLTFGFQAGSTGTLAVGCCP